MGSIFDSPLNAQMSSPSPSTDEKSNVEVATGVAVYDAFNPFKS